MGKIAESRRILQEHRTSHNRVFTSLDLMGQRKEGNLEGESVLQVDLLWDIGSLRQMHREGAKRISTMTSSSREDLALLPPSGTTIGKNNLDLKGSGAYYCDPPQLRSRELAGKEEEVSQ